MLIKLGGAEAKNVIYDVRELERLAMQLEDYFEFLSDDDIRIKGHRLGIDTVLEPFLNGFAPETIAQDYPELGLEKIYATITYYFYNQPEIDAYLQRLDSWRQQRYERSLQNPSPMAERMRALKAQQSLPSAYEGSVSAG